MKPIQTKEGVWVIDGDSHLSVWIKETGRLDHDAFLRGLIEPILKPGMVCIDAGALYGDHTIFMARAVSNPENSGCIIAIEANPMAFECLSKNAEKFQSQVICMNLALCEEHGGEAVHIMEENVGASKVSESKEKEPSKLEVKVKTACIDGISIDANLDRLDYIKIDCEGWEFKILKGAKNSLKKFRPLMLIEMNSFALSLQDACYKDIYDFLLEMEYSWRIVQPEAGGGSPQYDILCWPNPEPEKPKLYKAELINPAP